FVPVPVRSPLSDPFSIMWLSNSLYCFIFANISYIQQVKNLFNIYSFRDGFMSWFGCVWSLLFLISSTSETFFSTLRLKYLAKCFLYKNRPEKDFFLFALKNL